MHHFSCDFNSTQAHYSTPQVLRVLLKLLETSRDAKTLAVGCHDLGCFITHYPAGKGLVTGVLAHTDYL